MDGSTPAWLNTLTILGALLALGSAAFLVFRIGNARKTYQDLRPEKKEAEDTPSSSVVFMIGAAIMFALGVLLFGLGLVGSFRPDEVGWLLDIALA